jgi:hypothetical protein
MKRLTWLILPFTAALSSCGNFSREKQVTIETRLHFKKAGSSQSLEIQTPKEPVSLYWPSEAPKASKLSPNDSYTIDYFESRREFRLGSKRETFIGHELYRVTHHGHVIYDASICSVHKTKMKRTEVAITFGLIRPNQARMKELPQTGLVLGGCCPTDDEPKAWTWVCPTCVARERAWDEAHQMK